MENWSDNTDVQRYTWFEKPVQLKFWLEGEEDYCWGIGYRDEIICACCGTVVSLDEFYTQDFPEEIVPIAVYKDWVDFSDEIGD